MRNAIGLSLVIIAFASCTEPLEVTPFTFTQLLTGEEKKGWILRNVQIYEEGKGVETFGLDDCVMDDIYVFYANSARSYNVLNGSTKCSSDEADVQVQDEWSYSQATATLAFVFPVLSTQFAIPFTLKELEGSRMSIEYYFDDHNSYRFNFRSVSLE